MSTPPGAQQAAQPACAPRRFDAQETKSSAAGKAAAGSTCRQNTIGARDERCKNGLTPCATGNDSRGRAFFQQARRPSWTRDEVKRTNPHFEQCEVVIGDRPMVYRRSLHAGRGARVGPPDVVLVHGLGLSGRYMLPLAAHLAADHPVFLPDLPGFGDSSHPAGVLDVPGLADGLAAWLEAMGLRRPALLGNSFGCQIIIDLAVRHPERIGCAILQGPTAPAKERTWLMQAVRWRQNQPFNPPSLGPVTWGDYRKCGWIRLFRTFHYSLLDPIEAKLAKVACPALVVRGANDPICRADWAEYVAHRLPQGRLAQIPEVAHTLCYTAPAELAEASRAFLCERATAPRMDAVAS
jgi:2-hydroxy-6-oxonona-2,4-dienedioate hydrolase